MAAAEVTLSGILYDKLNRTSQQVVFIGDAMLTGVGIGGGPSPGGPPPWVSHPIPPTVWPNPPGNTQPPWYPGHPEHPIPPTVWPNPPGGPGGPPPWVSHPIPPTVWPNPPEMQPPGIWGGANEPFPTPPIYLPQPEPPEGTAVDWVAAWNPQLGWFVAGIPNFPHPTPSDAGRR